MLVATEPPCGAFQPSPRHSPFRFVASCHFVKYELAIIFRHLVYGVRLGPTSFGSGMANDSRRPSANRGASIEQRTGQRAARALTDCDLPGPQVAEAELGPVQLATPTPAFWDGVLFYPLQFKSIPGDAGSVSVAILGQGEVGVSHRARREA
jgi:hypothetical protein